MRSSSSPFTNPSGLVDKRLGHMWAQIEEVRALLPQIAHVSYYLESIFNLDRNLSLLADENVDHNILKDIQIFQGANAYEIAVREGYVGDVTSWLGSLKGDKGDQGDPGTTDQATLDTMNAATASALAAAVAAQATADANTAALPALATDARIDALEISIAADLSAQETSILNQVDVILNDYVDTTEAQTIADARFNALIATRDTRLASLESFETASDALLTSLQSDVAAQALEVSGWTALNATNVSRLDILEADLGTAEASITAIQTVNSGLALDVTSLQAANESRVSEITALQSVSSDNATAINALVSSNNSNSASITSEATTRASETGALATRTDTLEIDVGTLEGTVTTQGSLIGDINDRMTARYAISVDGGGNGAFVSLEDGVSTPSKIELDAALIELNGDVIITGTLNTPQMAADAVTERLVTNDTTRRAVASNQTHTTVESVVYNKTQSDSDIRIDFHCRHEGDTAIAGDDYALELHIRRNGVTQTLGDFWYYQNQGFPHSEFGSITISGVPTGNSTWSLTAKASNGGGISGVDVTRTQFTIEEIKK